MYNGSFVGHRFDYRAINIHSQLYLQNQRYIKQVVYNVYIKYVNFIKLIDVLYHAPHTCTDVYYTGDPTLNMKFNSFCIKIIPEVINAVVYLNLHVC